MTSPEFNQWWQDLATRFPSMASWFSRIQSLDPNINQTEHQRRVLRTWFDVLKDVPLADALEVNVKMQRGELEGIGGYDSDKEQTPTYVRKQAKEAAWEREQRMRRPEHEYSRRFDTFPAGKLLRRMIELEDQGVDRSEARAIAFREFESLIGAG